MARWYPSHFQGFLYLVLIHLTILLCLLKLATISLFNIFESLKLLNTLKITSHRIHSVFTIFAPLRNSSCLFSSERLILSCLVSDFGSLTTLADHNRVTIKSVSGHLETKENINPDLLTKKDASLRLIGPEPSC